MMFLYFRRKNAASGIIGKLLHGDRNLLNFVRKWIEPESAARQNLVVWV